MTTTTEPHEPYIQAVADALDAAGITVAEWRDVTDEYLDAYITLAESDGDGDLRMLGWDEEHGWSFHVGPRGEALIWWICADVLPEPGEVVEAIRRCVAGDFPPVTPSGAHYRSFTDEDDFSSRLAAYANHSNGSPS